MKTALPEPEVCNCLAIRQAARHVSQLYDECIAPSGLRGSQFSILARLKRHGATTINVLARDLVMDRTTLGRNILPLEREGLVAVRPGSADRRSKEVHLTEAGVARFEAGRVRWEEAQGRFTQAFGDARAAELRRLMRAVTITDFAADATAEPKQG